MRSAITSFVLPAVRSISMHMLAGQQQHTQPQHMLSLVHLGSHGAIYWRGIERFMRVREINA